MPSSLGGLVDFSKTIAHSDSTAGPRSEMLPAFSLVQVLISWISCS